MRVLLTASRALIAPAIIRNLARHGHKVITADSSRFGAGNSSNKRKKHIRIPSCRFREVDFVNAINDIVKKEQINLILPLGEEGYYLAKHRAELLCDCFVEDIEKIERLHNKMMFYALCMELDIKTPHTEIAKCAGENKVYKRIFSRCGESTTLSPRNIDFSSGEWLAQDYIKGTPISSFSVGENTLVYGARFYNKMEPFSNICVVNNNELKQQAEDISDKIRERTGYQGVIGLDFILADNGELFCIECNPRITSALLFMDKYDLLGILLKQSNRVEIKDETCKFIGYMFWQFLVGGVTPRNIKTYTSTMQHFKESVFSIRDVKPFFASYMMNLEWMYLAWKNKISVKEAASYDIQYNQSN